MKKAFTVGRVLELMKEPLLLELLSDDAGLSREILIGVRIREHARQRARMVGG